MEILLNSKYASQSFSVRAMKEKKQQQVNKTLTNFLGENRQSTESPNLYPYLKLLQTCQNINKTKDIGNVS